MNDGRIPIHNNVAAAITAVFVAGPPRTSSGLSDPYFINSSAEIRRELTYSVSIKSATTKGFL
jgi:hypothetical protein